MAKSTVALAEYLRKIGVEEDSDFLREGIIVLLKLLMEAEVSEQIGAERYERSDNRRGYRNGYRERTWETHGRDTAADTEAAQRFLLSELS